jgi:hypothetical protein
MPSLLDICRLFYPLAVLLIFTGCDNDILEPKGERRLKRIMNLEGFVKEEWNYDKKGKLENIVSFIRRPYTRVIGHKSDGTEITEENMLNEHPRNLSFRYTNEKLTEVEIISRSTCGCGSGGGQLKNLEYRDNKLWKVHQKLKWSNEDDYFDYNSVEISYSSDSRIISLLTTNSHYEIIENLYFDQKGENVVRYEKIGSDGSLLAEQHFIHDNKINPFYQKFIGQHVYDMNYWNKNNIISNREKNNYSGTIYHYFGESFK